MSFDLKIQNGDLVIGPDGDLAKVQDTEKLIQDVLKFLMTERGSNIFFTWYGSTLSSAMIGSPMDPTFIETSAASQIRSGLETIQNLQREQAAHQKVTPGELLAAIRSINVSRHPVNPLYYTIDLEILTKALRVAEVSFNVTL